MSYQFRRGLGETQEGGGAVSECFQAASRMIPGDKESWYTEWMLIADRNDKRGDEEEKAGHIRTRPELLAARRRLLSPGRILISTGEDPRRLPAFEQMEACSKKFIWPISIRRAKWSTSPTRPGKPICAYFVRAPFRDRLPGADFHGRPRQHQGRDVVHAGAWLPCSAASRYS